MPSSTGPGIIRMSPPHEADRCALDTCRSDEARVTVAVYMFDEVSEPSIGRVATVDRIVMFPTGTEEGTKPANAEAEH